MAKRIFRFARALKGSLPAESLGALRRGRPAWGGKHRPGLLGAVFALLLPFAPSTLMAEPGVAAMSPECRAKLRVDRPAYKLCRDEVIVANLQSVCGIRTTKERIGEESADSHYALRWLFGRPTEEVLEVGFKEGYSIQQDQLKLGHIPPDVYFCLASPEAPIDENGSNVWRHSRYTEFTTPLDPASKYADPDLLRTYVPYESDPRPANVGEAVAAEHRLPPIIRPRTNTNQMQ